MIIGLGHLNLNLSKYELPIPISSWNKLSLSQRKTFFYAIAGTFRSKTIENLNDWLAQMYNETAKFYTIKKCDHIGTFILYIAIDVTLDESKDDLHVVINSDHLQRPDAIFQLIDDCFRERKVHLIYTNL